MTRFTGMMLIGSAFLLSGPAMAASPQCQVNSKTVTLVEYQNPNADITAYHYEEKTEGFLVSLNYVDGAYDLYIEHGSNEYTQSRAETVDFKLILDGDTLEVQCSRF